ncbi:diguanylate cyclase domain-containing protein, partial [Shewanella sp. 0m-11]
TTRAEDTVGRLGGDEFIILLDGLSSANDAQPLAENLISGFRKPFYIDNRQLILTASIGIAIYPNDGETPSELLRNADSAMYHTKSIGRNTYSYFTHAMNKEVSRRLAIEEQIQGALERGELRVHYQIQLDIRDGSIMGAEALLRWSNPALGNVSPAEFIPIAEQTGMIEPMGE